MLMPVGVGSLTDEDYGHHCAFLSAVCDYQVSEVLFFFDLLSRLIHAICLSVCNKCHAVCYFLCWILLDFSGLTHLSSFTINLYIMTLSMLFLFVLILKMRCCLRHVSVKQQDCRNISFLLMFSIIYFLSLWTIRLQ